METDAKKISNYEKGRAKIDQILNERSLYKILGVEPDATTEEIRKAYLKTSRLIHPDKFRNDEDATRAFQMVSAGNKTTDINIYNIYYSNIIHIFISKQY